MMGVKGLDFLDTVWEMAVNKGCSCGNDDKFSQDVLGAIRCTRCNEVLLNQKEVDDLEGRDLLP